MGLRAIRFEFAAAIAACLAAACGPPPPPPGTVVLAEWSIRADRPHDGVIEVRNEGNELHQLAVATESGTLVAQTGLLEPGESQLLQVGVAGHLELSDRIVEDLPGEGLDDHTAKGMSVEVDW